MRLISRRCHRLAYHFPCHSCYPGVPRFSRLHLTATSAPQFARWVSSRGPLSSWNWKTSMKPESKDRKPTQDGPGETIREKPASKPESKDAPTPQMTNDSAPGSTGLGLDAAPNDNKIDREALRKEFYSILETGQPDQVMTALLDYDCEEFVATMPQTVFVEALRLLSPTYFIDPYKEIYRPLHPFIVLKKRFKAEHMVYDDFVRNLSVIIRIRQSAGHTLGIAEYTHLLDCARSIGDALMADYVWHAMKRDNIAPDLQCYNHYMEAKVWDGVFTGLEKYRIRMTPYIHRQRRFGDPGWQGYGTGKRSVRREIRSLYDEMTAAGHEGDETSVINLFMASARVGDKGAMKRVLMSIWNVEVDALKQGIFNNLTIYDRDSPFYPSSRLLFAVAHGFGTNNDMEAAVLVTRHLSEQYDLEVPDAVWAELFEWAFVISRPRWGPTADVKRLGSDTANVGFLFNLFDIMTSKSFNVEPTVDMLNKLAKCQHRALRLMPFVTHMRDAYNIMDKTRRKRKVAREMVESYLRYPRSEDKNMGPQVLRSRGFADAVHAYDILRLQVMQQTAMIERMARILLFTRKWTGKNNMAWDVRLRPQLIEEWRDFLPQYLRIHQQDGLIKIMGTKNLHSARLTIHQGLQLRYPSLQDDFVLDAAAMNELDDDTILNHYRIQMSQEDLKAPVLKRLFDPVLIEQDNYSDAPLTTDEEFNALSSNNEEAYADPDEEYPEQDYLELVRSFKWAELAKESRTRKDIMLDKTFGPLPASGHNMLDGGSFKEGTDAARAVEQGMSPIHS